MSERYYCLERGVIQQEKFVYWCIPSSLRKLSIPDSSTKSTLIEISWLMSIGRVNLCMIERQGRCGLMVIYNCSLDRQAVTFQLLPLIGSESPLVASDRYSLPQ
jgi:hypothetical protein